jgi:hypothetical protein
LGGAFFCLFILFGGRFSSCGGKTRFRYCRIRRNREKHVVFCRGVVEAASTMLLKLQFQGFWTRDVKGREREREERTEEWKRGEYSGVLYVFRSWVWSNI